MVIDFDFLSHYIGPDDYSNMTAYERHLDDMAWMFTPHYGYRSQADLDMCDDFQYALFILDELAQI